MKHEILVSFSASSSQPSPTPNFHMNCWRIEPISGSPSAISNTLLEFTEDNNTMQLNPISNGPTLVEGIYNFFVSKDGMMYSIVTSTPAATIVESILNPYFDASKMPSRTLFDISEIFIACRYYSSRFVDDVYGFGELRSSIYDLLELESTRLKCMTNSIKSDEERLYEQFVHLALRCESYETLYYRLTVPTGWHIPCPGRLLNVRLRRPTHDISIEIEYEAFGELIQKELIVGMDGVSTIGILFARSCPNFPQFAKDVFEVSSSAMRKHLIINLD